ncbi:hypothetical protein Hanom_Chr08g00734701 [Helianthus anomalus]
MASSFLSPAQTKLIDFSDTCKSQTHLFKLQVTTFNHIISNR